MKHPNAEIMKMAIELARKGYEESGFAVGAIIVKGDEIISQGINTSKKDSDPTAHAEIVAIRNAGKKLGTRKLEDCYLYTTYEPCPMCASAAIWGRMKGIIYGASRKDSAETHPWRVEISCEKVLKQGTPTLELYPEFMREECKNLLNLV
jgi:tRNA(Arg) A34 adenosine deaminase TadA